MIKSILRVSSIVIALLGVTACSHEHKPSTYAPGASAPAGELNGAVKDITSARCDLEQRCNNIGAGQSYDNREACESKLRASTADDLNTKDCPQGVDRSKLSACLSQIQSEECGNPVDTMSRWNACRKGQLCVSN